MKSFEADFIAQQHLNQGLLQAIRLLGEHKGKQEMYKEQSPQVLETLRQAAIIQSTESSNRIEGITAPHERIKQLVAEKTTPRNRSEQEIAGYRDVLNTIHSNYAAMPFTTGLVLQLHRDLYKFTSTPGGRWKVTNNEITEIFPDGTKRLRFQTVSAFATAENMEQLHQRFTYLWESGEVEPLLLIPSYVLDFLCIHPFLDGNGRMARLLSLLLLYQAGYEVGRFISLEKITEDTKETYYDSLHKSSQLWHEGEHSLVPWWEYFLGVMTLSAYREFEERTGILTQRRGAKREMLIDAVNRLPKQFKFADLVRLCPGVSRPTINRGLAELRKTKQIKCIKSGRDATWEKI